MSGQSMEELLARVDELERRTAEAPVTPPRRRITRARRVVLATVALAGLLLIPVGVFANHQFSDVPTDSTFHGNISRLREAGLTSGCTPTTFCPTQNVTRGQMAAFITRAAGRAGFNGDIGFTLTDDPQDLFSIDVKAGDITGGFAQVTVTGYVLSVVQTDVTGCPCTAAYYVGDGTTSSFFPHLTGISDINYSPSGGTALGFASTPIIWDFVVPTGVTTTITLSGERIDGTKTIEGWGWMVANAVPFGGTGENVGVSGESGFEPSGELPIDISGD